jgi:hypothetical protein
MSRTVAGLVRQESAHSDDAVDSGQSSVGMLDDLPISIGHRAPRSSSSNYVFVISLVLEIHYTRT